MRAVRREYVETVVCLLQEHGAELELEELELVPEEGEDYYVKIECEVSFCGSGRAYSFFDKGNIMCERPENLSMKDIVWDEVDVVDVSPLPKARELWFDMKGEPFDRLRWMSKRVSNIVSLLREYDIQLKPFYFEVDKEQTTLDGWL